MTGEPQVSLDSVQLYRACYSPDEQVRYAAYEILWEYLYRVALKVVYDQPDAEALAQDCAQTALLRIHERLTDCNEPNTFRAWARRITSNVAIDALRRQKRLIPLETGSDDERIVPQSSVKQSGVDTEVLNGVGLDELRSLLSQAPMSTRSQRLVLGRYLDGKRDEELARIESDLVNQTVLSSHIQVTRSKNISKLRDWKPLQLFYNLNMEK
ncbi:MAG: RNA polymerase sigma factor [Anaerolineales bacterium]|nr:RNA polymerase sigma factor [Anaerolineales bacterium]